MKIRKKILPRSGIQDNLIQILNPITPNYISWDADEISKQEAFYTLFVTEPLNFFEQEGREDEVFEFYEKCLYTIPYTRNTGTIKLNGEYWEEKGLEGSFNHDYTKHLDILEYRKIDLKRAEGIAIWNLWITVQDKNLSLGDKLLIKNIALNGFYNALEIAVDPDDKRFEEIASCVRTDLNESLIYPLRSYGFKVERPWKRFRIIDVHTNS